MDADPVVTEIRRHGARIAEECAGDIRRMAERFRREQTQNADRVVRRGPQNRQSHRRDHRA